MSLKPEKGCVAMSLLGVYTPIMIVVCREVPPLVRYEIQCPCGAPDLSYCRLTEVTNPANHDLVAIFCEGK